MSNPVDIQAGNQTIGELSIQNGEVSGEGGPYDPRLVLPITVSLHPRPMKRALALLDVTCSLHLTGSTSDQNQLGPSVTVPLSREQMRFRTFPGAPQSQGFQLRLPLQQPQITLLETHRHQQSDKAFRGFLRVIPTVGWMYEIGNSWKADGTPDGPVDELETQLGMYSKFAQLWTTRVSDLRVEVPSSVWVERVLPGLGLDRLRLVEISLPTISSLVPEGVVTHFDAARQDYDLGYYRECVEKCRYVRDALSSHLGTTRDRQLGDVVADRRGLPADAPIRDFWNRVWLGWWNLTNAGHHLPTPQPFTPADARACLMTTALILEFLGQLR